MRNYNNHLLLGKSTVKQALIRLDILASDAILFIVDDEDRLIGALTDGDVRRGLIKGVTIDDEVSSIIQENPRFIKKGKENIQKIIEYRDGNFKILPAKKSG